MKRNIKSNSSVYGFLEQKGVLQLGDDKSIQDAKKEYWRDYKRQWKKLKRHQNKSYTILLSEDEAKLVIREAKKYHTSPTGYIKKAALTNKQISDPVAIGELRELLFLHYGTLQTITEQNMISEQLGHRVLEEITEIEKKVFALLYQKNSSNDS